MGTEIETTVRKWGRSLGVVIPKEAVLNAKLRKGEKIHLTINKEKSPFKAIFGTLKTSRSTAEILKEVDQEGWDE